MTLFCPGLPEETETVADRFCLKYNLNLVKSEANPKKIGKTIKPDLILLAPGQVDKASFYRRKEKCRSKKAIG